MGWERHWNDYSRELKPFAKGMMPVFDLNVRVISVEEMSQSMGVLDSEGRYIPKHKIMMKQGELVTVNDCTFKVAYISDKTVVLEPVSGIIEKEEE